MKFVLNNFKIIWVLISIFIHFSCTNIDDKIFVRNLKCEYLINPLSIDVKSPRLSWEINCW